jgi:AsmA-like C-terminal region
MRDDLIYAKTQAGEEAVLERRRLVQRNLRMVLILVDGVVDVAGLKREVGDAAMVESALAELERLGLIVTNEADEPIESNIDASEIETIPTVEDLEPPVANALEIPLVQADTLFDEETAAELMTFARPAPPASNPDGSSKPQWKSPLTDITGWWESARKERAQAKEEAIYEEAYGKDPIEEVDVLPLRRPGITLVFRWSWLVTAAIGFAAVALLTLVLFPYDNYRHDFEQRLGLAVGDEVRIGEVRLVFTPYPAIELDRVSVGSDPYVTINKVQLLAEFGSFMGPRYRQVNVKSMHVKEAGLDRLSKWFLPAGLGDAAIDRMDIDGLAVDVAGGTLGGLYGTATIDPLQGLSDVALRVKEGNLRVDVKPEPTGVGIDLFANGWTAPFHPELQLSYLEMHGQLVPGRLTLNNIDARLYDGAVNGDGIIAWAQEPTMTLKLAFQHMSAEQLLSALGTQPLVDGTANGKFQVDAKAVAVQRLDNELRFTGNFAVERGSFKRVDLADAIRSAPQTVLRGGTTRFQEFSGRFTADKQSVRLSGLHMDAGLMQVTGEVTLSRPDQTLRGWAGMEMHGSAIAAKATVAITGDVHEPDIRVSPGR